MSWGQAGGWKLPRGPESKNFQGLGANFSGLNVRGGGGWVSGHQISQLESVL